ncbi:hypothetical protein, partial [Altererythrobacter litoralis]|nr:hypothetical protein [Erythrobacteraceae bacterium 1XM1-14]
MTKSLMAWFLPSRSPLRLMPFYRLRSKAIGALASKKLAENSETAYPQKAEANTSLINAFARGSWAARSSRLDVG